MSIRAITKISCWVTEWASGEKKRQSRKVGSTKPSRTAGKAVIDNCLANDETNNCEKDVTSSTPAENLETASSLATTSLADSNNVLSWDMGGLDVSNPPSIVGFSDQATIDSSLDSVPYLSELDSCSVESPLSFEALGPVSPRAPYNTLSPSELSTDGIDLSFPDSYLLPVSEFALMRAFLRIAARLGCKTNIFDLHARSPFGDPSTAVAHLPQSWQPTAAQILIPHHPILDFIPWPSVRERIIYTLTLPEEMVRDLPASISGQKKKRETLH